MTPEELAAVDIIQSERDVNFSCLRDITSHLGITVTPDNKTESVANAKIAIDTLHAKVAQLTSERDELATQAEAFKNDVEAITDENKSIADLYQTELEKNSATIKSGRRAIDILNDTRSFLYALCDHFKIPYKGKKDKDVVMDILDEVIKKEQEKITTPTSPVKSKFDPTPEPTVSQAIARAAVATDKMTLRRFVILALQKAGVLVK